MPSRGNAIDLHQLHFSHNKGTVQVPPLPPSPRNKNKNGEDRVREREGSGLGGGEGFARHFTKHPIYFLILYIHVRVVPLPIEA